MAADTSGSQEADDNVLSAAIADIGPMAMKKWPDQYGWVRIEPGHPENGVEVGFTEGAAEKVSEIAESFPQPELLRPISVPLSHVALRAHIKEIAGDREAAKSGEGPLADLESPHFDLQSDVWSGKVEAIMPKVSQETRDVFERTYGDLVVVQEGGLGHPASCTSRKRCGKELRAGIAARNQPSFDTFKCSVGFTIMVAGEKQVLSAAHCSNLPYGSTGGALPSQHRYHGEVLPTEFGTVQAHYLYGGVDAERISVNAPFNANPWIYREDTDQQFPVESMGTWAEVAFGQTLCRAGQTTGRRCGYVTKKDYTPDRGGTDFIRFTACSEGGDSGGPVFNGTKAWGVFDGWIDSNDHDPHCGDGDAVHSYAGAINWALNKLGATLVYAP
ncbi:MAG: hypothetical protein J0H98_03255 [Solirubrobacterales bacterium]|nr:hypothetical protein [Solirubrobacterales bacterium]